MKKIALIIGAGPAGLTAAAELQYRTKIKPVIIERTNRAGGLSTTIDYKGYKLDIGGHRFFTKSNRVMEWWLERLPLGGNINSSTINYHGKHSDIKITPSLKTDTIDIMLLRKRRSRIYYNGKLFSYPLEINMNTARKLGLLFSLGCLISYLRALMFPRKENNLEDFFINRFGYKLYKTFFKTYTEKVWGKKCTQISAEWGAQRVKGLSIGKALISSLSGKSNETSLIEHFLYPKYGPGQLWNKVADEIVSKKGQILLENNIKKIVIKNNKIHTVLIRDKKDKTHLFKPDYLFSTMAIKELVSLIDPPAPKKVTEIASKLEYRDFIAVGLLFNKFKAKKLLDNWIYVHDPLLKVGRIQFFENWSPYMLKDKNKLWVGMEYFVNEGDMFWQKNDKEILKYAKDEFVRAGFSKKEDFVDGVVVKMHKAYPSYTGAYKDFAIVKNYLDRLSNLYLIGRNGMHKYNNQDHSMLTAMVAVDNIVKGRKSKANIWAVNAEEDYHEEK